MLYFFLGHSDSCYMHVLTIASDFECNGTTRYGVKVLGPPFFGCYLPQGPTNGMLSFWESRDLRIFNGPPHTPWGMGLKRLWCDSFMPRWAPFIKLWGVGDPPTWLDGHPRYQIWWIPDSNRWHELQYGLLALGHPSSIDCKHGRIFRAHYVATDSH